MRNTYLLLIIAFANNFFFLLPNGRLGGLNTDDVGLLLIAIGLVYYAKGGNLRPLGNIFTWWVLFYLLMVLALVSFVAVKYSQSFTDSLITGRAQLYYLSFPLFLLALNDLQKVHAFMKALSMLAIGVIILSLINYFGPTLFYHGRADHHEVRSGVVRAYLPAMSVIVLAALWQFWTYLRENRALTGNLIMFLVLYGAIVSRQTRGRFIAVTATLLLMLIMTRRYRLLVAGMAMVLIGMVAQVMLGGESILLDRKSVV